MLSVIKRAIERAWDRRKLKIKADAGDADSQYSHWLSNSSKQESLIYLQSAAHQGHCNAQISLGKRYLWGHQVEESKELAVFYFTMAINSLNNQALELEKVGKLDKALKIYNESLEILPNHAETLLRKGAILASMDQHDNALECYDKSLKVRPSHNETINKKIISLSKKGKDLKSIGKFNEAVDIHNQILEIQPGNVDTLNEKAEVLSKNGDYLVSINQFEEALKNYDQSLLIKPADANALRNKGILLKKSNRLDEALISFNQALKINPDDFETLYYRSNTLSALGRLEEALEGYDNLLKRKRNDDILYFQSLTLLNSYNQILKTHPENLETITKRGLLLQANGRFGEALEDLNQSLKMQPDNADVLSRRDSIINMSQFYELPDSYQNSLSAIIIHSNPITERQEIERSKCYQMLKHKPTHFKSYNILGKIALLTGQHELALFYYNKSIDIHFENAEALFQKGKIFIAMGKRDEAIEWLNLSLKFNPVGLSAKNLRDTILAAIANDKGSLLARQSQWSEALNSYNDSLALNPKPNVNRRITLRNKGIVLIKLCKWSEALDSLDNALKLMEWKNDAEIFENRGIALTALERIAEALDSYNISLKLRYSARTLFKREGVLKQLDNLYIKLCNANELLKNQPDNASLLAARSEILKKVGRFGEALDSYNISSSAQPVDAYILPLEQTSLESITLEYKSEADILPFNSSQQNESNSIFSVHTNKNIVNTHAMINLKLQSVKIASIASESSVGSQNINSPSELEQGKKFYSFHQKINGQEEKTSFLRINIEKGEQRQAKRI